VTLLEICLDDIAGAAIAEQSRADRIELCADLARGGTTPSIGTVATVLASVNRVGVRVLVRQRSGDFVYGSLETLIDLGVDRMLTSGGAPTALAGAGRLAELVQQSQGRISVLAGGGVRAHNVAEIVRRTGVGEVHLRATSTEAATADSSSTSADVVRSVHTALKDLRSAQPTPAGPVRPEPGDSRSRPTG
jgi:copper homeostasis protein CutC